MSSEEGFEALRMRLALPFCQVTMPLQPATHQQNDHSALAAARKDAFFQNAYELIARDKAQHNAVGFASHEHQLFVFQSLACDDLFKVKGESGHAAVDVMANRHAQLRDQVAHHALGADLDRVAQRLLC